MTSLPRQRDDDGGGAVAGLGDDGGHVTSTPTRTLTGEGARSADDVGKAVNDRGATYTGMVSVPPADDARAAPAGRPAG